MKKYLIPLIIICFVFFFLVFIINRKSVTDTKFYLDEDLYNQKNVEVTIKSSELEKLIDKKASFVIFFSMPYCTFDVPCENIFRDVFKKYDTSFYSISFSDIKGTKLNEKIKYAPTFAVFRGGELVAFLDPNSDEDLKMYESKEEFTKWIKKYIYLDR